MSRIFSGEAKPWESWIQDHLENCEAEGITASLPLKRRVIIDGVEKTYDPYGIDLALSYLHPETLGSKNVVVYLTPYEHLNTHLMQAKILLQNKRSPLDFRRRHVFPSAQKAAAFLEGLQKSLPITAMLPHAKSPLDYLIAMSVPFMLFDVGKTSYVEIL